MAATRRVAVVLPRLDSWFSSTMLATVESTLRQADLDVLVYQVSSQETRTHFFRDLPTRRKVDAVVLITLPIRPEEEERLDLMGVEVVVAGSRLRDFPSVSVDDVAIGREAVEHLVGLGHTRIGMIRTSDTDGAKWASDLHRRTGYLEALERHGMPHDPALVVTAPYGVDAGAVGMEQLLRSTTRRPRSSATPTTSPSPRRPRCAATACASPRTSPIGVDGHGWASSSTSRPSISTWSTRRGRPA